MKTIFFGASSYTLPIIEYLKKNFELALVVTTEIKPTDAVPHYCKENNINYVSVTTLSDKDLKSYLLNLKSPFAVIAHFGLIVPQEIIDIFPKGIINIHPSLLPEYRGSTPGTTAILDGKTETGVSIMLLDNQLDHGPILAQEKIEIEPDDTAVTFYMRAFELGTNMLAKCLPEYLDNKLTPVPQDDTKATYTKTLKREDGLIDLSVISKEERLRDPQRSAETSGDFSASPRNDNIELLKRKVRAYYPWPGVYTKMTLYGKEKIVKLLPNMSSILFQVEGKKPMTVKDFLNGYPEAEEIIKKLI